MYLKDYKIIYSFGRSSFYSWFHYCLAIIYLLFVRILYKRTKDVKIQPSNWKRVLLISDHQIGDLLFLTCSLNLLKEKLPNCKIECLCNSNSESILKNNPYVHDVLPFFRFDKRFKLIKGTKEILIKKNYDAAIIASKIRYWDPLLLSVCLRIPIRICYSYKGMEHLITRKIGAVIRGAPYPMHFRLLIHELFGDQNIKINELTPELYLDEASKKNAKRILISKGISIKGDRIIIFNSSRTNKVNYPVSKLIHLIKLINTKYKNVNVILCAAKDESEKMDELIKCPDIQITTFIGELNLMELASIIQISNVVFGPDSGPRHITNAMHTPMVFYRNLQNPKIEFGKYCKTEIDILQNIDIECASEKIYKEILNNIRPEDVLCQLESYFSGHS
jgi:ADP-heptose:LPS heptosyltransferase